MIEKRISYYTRKVAEYGSIHVSKRRNKYRHDRLMNYKRKINELANERSRTLKQC